MEYLTAQIIMLCKQPQNFGEFQTRTEAIIAYNSLRCGITESYYKNHMEIVEDFIIDCLRDYLDTCANPSHVIYEIYDHMKFQKHCEWMSNTHKNPDMMEAILSAFALSEVQMENVDTGEYEYINGFTEENTHIPTPEDFP